MSLDFAALDHSCNVVRREIEEEFRNLSVIFIPHAPSERRKALADRRNAILAKPYGRRIYDILSANPASDADKTDFLGLIAHDTGFLNLFSKKHYTAIFFINTDDVMLEGNSKLFIYHLAWHSLALYQKTVQDPKSLPQPDSVVIRHKNNALNSAKNNLMADIFGAILMESQGHKGFIEELAQQRSLNTLSAKPGFIAELYPYPIAYEASRLLYEDIKAFSKNQTQILHQALEITQEITITYSDETILQWWEFSRPAQEMAWQDHLPPEILGQAIYISENTNVRALAYQLAELSDISPASTTQTLEYNPFAVDEANRRQHEALCEDIFGRLVSIAALQNDSYVFHQEEDKQNERLLSGKVTGWCALSLEKAAHAFHSTRQSEDAQPAEFAAQIFYQNLRAQPWSHSKMLSALILKLRRTKEQISLNDLRSALTQKSDLMDIYDYFERKLSPALPEGVQPRPATRVTPNPLEFNKKSYPNNADAENTHGGNSAAQIQQIQEPENYTDEANFIRNKLMHTNITAQSAPPPPLVFEEEDEDSKADNEGKPRDRR